MQLHTAIRLGALLRPPAKYFYDELDHGTCAMGAALDAVGALNTYDTCNATMNNVTSIELYFPETNTYIERRYWAKAIPDERFSERKLANIIIELNDENNWTRERIADWVEEIAEIYNFYPAPQSEILEHKEEALQECRP